MKAKRLWNDMYTRCYNTKLHKRFPEYRGCSICDYWLEDKERFYKWVEKNYYMIGNEQMDLDKDILFKGNKVYSPKRKRGKYPLGVNYEKAKGKYRAALNVDGKTVKLGHFDTAEEAFMAYKRHKEALIIVVADRYKGKIPNCVYEAMMTGKLKLMIKFKED